MDRKSLTWNELTDSEREFISGIVDMNYNSEQYAMRYEPVFIKGKLQLVLTKPSKKSRIKK